MASMTRKSESERQAWLAPGLEYRGTVGDLTVLPDDRT